MHLSEQQKKPNKNVRGPVVKEFQWFQMETRLRKIIQQIIEPIQYQIVQNSSHLERLQKTNVGFNQKIQYMLKMTTNDPQVFEKGVFKKIQEKFQKQQKTLSFLQQEVKNNTHFIDNKITLIDQRMKESNDMISQIQQLKASNRQNLKNQTQKFDTIRKNIQQNVQTMSQAIQQNQKNSRQKIQRQQKQISQNEMKMQNIFKQFSKVKEYFQGQKSINDNLISQQIKLKQENRLLEVKINEMNKKIKQLSKIKPFLQDIEVEYKKVLFKIDNIVPLITQSQINECLYRIMPQKFHPRVAVYEFQRYKDLNQKVLNRKFDTQPLSVQFNGQQVIRKAQQRNTKLLTKLKLKYYKNNGVELDFISFQERQKLMNDFDYQKLTEIIDELQQLQNEQNHNKKNMRLSQEDVVEIVQKYFQTEKRLLTQKISTEIQHSKTDIQSTTEVISVAVDKLQNRFMKLTQKFLDNTNKFELFMKNIEQNFLDLNSNNKNYSENINSLHLFGQQIHFCLEQFFSYVRNTQQSSNQNFNGNHENFTINQKKMKKHPKYHSEYKDIKNQHLNDSDDPQQFKFKNHEKNDQFSITQFYEKLRVSLKNVKKHLETYQEAQQKIKEPINHKSRSSYSKLTKAQQSLLKFKSHSLFESQKTNMTASKLESSKKSINKKEVSEFLKIPEFKIDSGRKYCRESHTSRLSMRKKPSFSPSRALFQQSQKQTQGIKSSQVRNSLSNFTELMKEHKRYLS